MRCSVCGADNPPGALTCHRCTEVLLGGPLDDAPTDPDMKPLDLRVSSPPKILVTPATRALAPSPPTPVKQRPAPISVPPLPFPELSVPSQPPLPANAPRAALEVDDIPFSISFNQTFVGPPPAPEIRKPPLEPSLEAGETLPETLAEDLVPVGASELHRSVRLAPLWRRVLAGVIDLLIVGALTSIYLWVAIARLSRQVGPVRGAGFDRLIDAALIYAEATLPGIGVLLALWALYQLIAVAATGRTIGLWLVGAAVVSVRSPSVGLGAALLRALSSTLGLVLLALGWSAALLSRRRRCWHDVIAGTLVGTAQDVVRDAIEEATDPDLAPPLAEPPLV